MDCLEERNPGKQQALRHLNADASVFRHICSLPAGNVFFGFADLGVVCRKSGFEPGRPPIVRRQGYRGGKVKFKDVFSFGEASLHTFQGSIAPRVVVLSFVADARKTAVWR